MRESNFHLRPAEDGALVDLHAVDAMSGHQTHWSICPQVDAICRYSDPKNTALFEAMGVLKPNECAAA